jgi:hypothetical protein
VLLGAEGGAGVTGFGSTCEARGASGGGAAFAATTTKTGLKVRCELDQNTYPAGIKVSDAEMEAVHLTRHDFHGE